MSVYVRAHPGVIEEANARAEDEIIMRRSVKFSSFRTEDLEWNKKCSSNRKSNHQEASLGSKPSSFRTSHDRGKVLSKQFLSFYPV